jgi:hypothetical protein
MSDLRSAMRVMISLRLAFPFRDRMCFVVFFAQLVRLAGSGGACVVNVFRFAFFDVERGWLHSDRVERFFLVALDLGAAIRAGRTRVLR